jgi:hypothetical protein
MLTFDTPFEGKITQQRQSGTILIKLNGISIESPKIKKLNSKFLNKITITPISNQVQILALVPNNIVMQASKTSDAYGLRLRFLKAKSTQTSSNSNQKNTTLTSLDTKKGSALEDNYIIIVTILILGILIIYWLKRSLAKTLNNSSRPSVFKSDKITPNSNEASIRFQKPLDQHNSVIMLDYAKESYLVIIGNNNVVLDKFHDTKPVTQNEFETVLDSKEEELESYLKLDKIDKIEADEVLESYKEKASL